jgi:riboflavin synthase
MAFWTLHPRLRAPPLGNRSGPGYTPGKMFTGIVETTGVLATRAARGEGARLSVATTMGPLVVGESIAVHGACLTVQTVTPNGFECDATVETLGCTTLGAIPVGGHVHLERSLAVGDRLGGHIVSGHVDGKVRLRTRRSLSEALELVFEIEEPSLAKFIAPKGSVAVNGVSLTVNRVAGAEFDVVIIPHTLAVTTLGELAPGQEANLEVDLLARYVARLLDTSAVGSTGDRDARLLETLKTAGFI